MSPRLARRLAALYPCSWRERYGNEFAAFLEGEPSSLSNIVNIMWSACREHVRRGFHTMTPARRLTLLMYACLAAMTAGVNLYWTIDDTPLVPVMRAHAAIAASWAVVAFGSAVALAIAALAALPIVRRLLAAAAASRRYDLIARLVIPFCALAVVIAWMSIVIARTDWAPMPWNISGAWHAPDGWPSLTVRWVLGGVTGALIATSLAVSAVALRQAIEAAAPSDSSYLRVTLTSLAAVVVMLSVAALGWGLFAEIYAPAAFHSSAGGIFGSSIAVSWIFSLALFLGAAVIAVRGAHAHRRRVA